jgi:hypothetical protein
VKLDDLKEWYSPYWTLTHEDVGKITRFDKEFMAFVNDYFTKHMGSRHRRIIDHESRFRTLLLDVVDYPLMINFCSTSVWRSPREGIVMSDINPVYFPLNEPQIRAGKTVDAIDVGYVQIQDILLMEVPEGFESDLLIRGPHGTFRSIGYRRTEFGDSAFYYDLWAPGDKPSEPGVIGLPYDLGLLKQFQIRLTDA